MRPIYQAFNQKGQKVRPGKARTQHRRPQVWEFTGYHFVAGDDGRTHPCARAPGLRRLWEDKRMLHRGLDYGYIYHVCMQYSQAKHDNDVQANSCVRSTISCSIARAVSDFHADARVKVRILAHEA